MYKEISLCIKKYQEKQNGENSDLKYTLIKQYKKHRYLTHGEVIELHRRRSSGSYEFGRMYRLFIPKAPGKVGLRPITIPHSMCCIF